MLSHINNFTLPKFQYGQITDLLEKLGYTKANSMGGHARYQHKDSISTILLREMGTNQEIPPAIVASIMTNVVNQHVTTERRLESLIKEVKKESV